MDEGLVSWLILVPVAVATLLLVLSRLRARALGELRNVLYARKDLALFLRLLDNPHLRILFSRQSLQALRVEGMKYAEGHPFPCGDGAGRHKFRS